MTTSKTTTWTEESIIIDNNCFNNDGEDNIQKIIIYTLLSVLQPCQSVIFSKRPSCKFQISIIFLGQYATWHGVNNQQFKKKVTSLLKKSFYYYYTIIVKHLLLFYSSFSDLNSLATSVGYIFLYHVNNNKRRFRSVGATESYKPI